MTNQDFNTALTRRRILPWAGRFPGRFAAATAGCLLLSLAACGPEYDPLTREGLWQPQHINRANLVLMVANPADLARGTGTPNADGHLAAAAVERLRNDNVKKLPASDVSQVSVSSSGSNNSGGGQ